MNVLEIIKFRYSDSFVHKMDPRVKFFLACTFAFIAIMYDQVYVLLPLLIVQLMIMYYGKVLKTWASSSKLILGLAFIVFLITFITQGSLLYSTSMAIRWANFFTSFSWFLLTTSPDDFGQGLKQMHLSYNFTFAVILAFRFIPVIVDETEQIIDAQRSRGLEIDKGSPIKRIKNLIPILIPLIASIIRRSFELTESLSSRAYGIKNKRTSMYEIKAKKTDIVIFVLSLIVLISSIYFLKLI